MNNEKKQVAPAYSRKNQVVVVVVVRNRVSSGAGW
jgi:hypothetical protein